MSDLIRLNELKSTAILFPGDLFVLAAFLLQANGAIERAATAKRRQSLHGLCARYVGMDSQLNLERIESDLRKLDLPEWDDDEAASDKPEEGKGVHLRSNHRSR